MESASLYFQFHAWQTLYRAIFNALLIKRGESSKLFSVLSHLLFFCVQLTMLKRALAKWWRSTDAVIRTDRRTVTNSQVLLLPWAGGGHHASSSILCVDGEGFFHCSCDSVTGDCIELESHCDSQFWGSAWGHTINHMVERKII